MKGSMWYQIDPCSESAYIQIGVGYSKGRFHALERQAKLFQVVLTGQVPRQFLGIDQDWDQCRENQTNHKNHHQNFPNGESGSTGFHGVVP